MHIFNDNIMPRNAANVSLRSCLVRNEILLVVKMIVLCNADLRINVKIIVAKLVKRNIFPKEEVALYYNKKCLQISAVL